MRTVVLREGLGPAEQDFLQMFGCLTLNAGRKLLEIPCVEVTVTDSFFLDVRIRNDKGIETQLRIPNQMVLLVAITVDDRPSLGFVGPMRSSAPPPVAPSLDPAAM